MAHQNLCYERAEDERIRSRNEERKFENSSSSPTKSIATFYSSNSDSSESEDEAPKTEKENGLKREKEQIFNRKNFYESTDALRRRKERRYRKRSHSRSRSISPNLHKSQQRNRTSGAEEPLDHQQSCVKSEESIAKTEKEERRVHDDAIKASHQKISSQSPNNNIVLPSYYNRKMINPKKYAEQIRKRKLLWGRKVQYNDVEDSREQQTCNFWQKTSFNDDENGKTTAKFKRLMGIRSESKNVRTTVSDDTSQLEERQTDVIEKQKEMFDSMQNQYEAARVATHTHRGVGLGFGMFPFHTQ